MQPVRYTNYSHLRVRPANQPAITAVALCRKKNGNPCSNGYLIMCMNPVKKHLFVISPSCITIIFLQSYSNGLIYKNLWWERTGALTVVTEYYCVNGMWSSVLWLIFGDVLEQPAATICTVLLHWRLHQLITP